MYVSRPFEVCWTHPQAKINKPSTNCARAETQARFNGHCLVIEPIGSEVCQPGIHSGRKSPRRRIKELQRQEHTHNREVGFVLPRWVYPFLASFRGPIDTAKKKITDNSTDCRALSHLVSRDTCFSFLGNTVYGCRWGESQPSLELHPAAFFPRSNGIIHVGYRYTYTPLPIRRELPLGYKNWDHKRPVS